MRRLNPAGRAARELGGDKSEADTSPAESQLASRLPEWQDLKEHAKALEHRRTLKRAVPAATEPAAHGSRRPRAWARQPSGPESRA